jgi:hypothetical protein
MDAGQRTSLINVVRNVALKEVPGGIIIFVVTSFEGGDGSNFNISIDGPRQKEIFTTGEQPIQSEPSPESKFIQMSKTMVVRLAPIIFKREGIYHIVLRIGGKVIHREPFGVYIISTEEKE